MTSTLILLRHGQSTWNADNLFTGWWDADLSEKGVAEATMAGELMLEARLEPTVVHTSLQTRAIRTANLALDAMGRLWLPTRRHWRLNERHYGALTGRNKAEAVAEFGEDQVHVWRRSYEVPPPRSKPGGAYDPNTDPRYAAIPADLLPRSECLADVVARMLPYWFDVMVPDLAGGRTVLVAAHGNSLRALVKHLDGIADANIAGLDIPTGIPLVYEIGDDAHPSEAKAPLDRALGDAAAVKAAAEAVANQATASPEPQAPRHTPSTHASSSVCCDPMASSTKHTQHLTEIPLFSSLSKKDVGRIAKASNEVTLPAGSVIVDQGDAGRDAYVILEGTATVKRNGRKVATLSTGDSVGELALLDHGPRTATVTADSEVTALVLTPRELQSVLDEVPELSRKLLASLAGRVRELDRQIYG